MTEPERLLEIAKMALKKYGRHFEDVIQCTYPLGKCKCGLQAALTAIGVEDEYPDAGSWDEEE